MQGGAAVGFFMAPNTEISLATSSLVQPLDPLKIGGINRAQLEKTALAGDVEIHNPPESSILSMAVGIFMAPNTEIGLAAGLLVRPLDPPKIGGIDGAQLEKTSLAGTFEIHNLPKSSNLGFFLIYLFCRKELLCCSMRYG